VTTHDARSDSPFDAVGLDASDGSMTDGSINVFEIFPIPDGAGAACATCLSDQCGMQINTCVNDMRCRDGFACALQNCIGAREGGTPDGGLDFACINTCFMGNFAAIGEALAAFGCITRQCGGMCIGSGMLDGSVIDVSVGEGGSGDASVSDSSALDAALDP
jgi:hypothetical protein